MCVAAFPIMCIRFVFARRTGGDVPAVQIGEWAAVPLTSLAADRDEAVDTCARLGGFLLYVGECAFCAWRAGGVEEGPRQGGGSRPAAEMVLVSVHVPPAMLEAMDLLVAAGLYQTRSHLIRAAIEELLQRYRPGRDSAYRRRRRSRRRVGET